MVIYDIEEVRESGNALDGFAMEYLTRQRRTRDNLVRFSDQCSMFAYLLPPQNDKSQSGLIGIYRCSLYALSDGNSPAIIF